MSKSNLAKNTALLSIGTMLTKGINLIMIPLFSAWLSTEDYGMYDLLATYVSLLIPFITLSSSDAVFRFVIESNADDDKKKYISTAFGINAINTCIVILGLIVVRLLTGWEYTLPFITLLVSELFLNHLQGVTRAIKQLRLYALANVVSTVGIASSVTFFVLVLKLGLTGMLYGYTVGYLIGEVLLVVSIKYWKYIHLSSISFETVKQLVAYSYTLIPNNICWWIINVSDRTLINIFLGAAANGIYAIACKIPNFCASVFNVFNISWQEAAIDMLNSDKRNEYYNSIYNNTVSTMISLCAGVLSLNFFLFTYIFNERYFTAAFYAPILITSIVFSSLTQYFGGIQISLKRPKENGITTMIGAVVNVLIDLVLIKVIGIYAAAISTLVSNIVICVIRYIRLYGEIEFKLERKTCYYIVYYIYMFGMSYVFKSVVLSALNLLLASAMFCVINREFIYKIIKKVVKQ